MSSISLNAVEKYYDSTAALQKTDLSIEAGTFTVLLGPSGCGKSTTLRLIAGLESPTSGTVEIGGRDVTNLPPAERGLSMVFQSYALFPHLSVAENIQFGLKVRRVPAAERRQRLEKTCALLSLSELVDRKPYQLSGGQQQRVALGRAVISEQKICLMDEPLSNLDAKLRHDMRRELCALQRKLDLTVVYVTHDQTEAITMADQVILLNSGSIEQHCGPRELYEKPRTLFAARFIGQPAMNIVNLVRFENEQYTTPGSDSPFIRLVGNDLPDVISLGIRPEDISVSDHDGISVIVSGGEYLGADLMLNCMLGGSPVIIRCPPERLDDFGSTGLDDVHQKVSLNWLPRKIHLFDDKSGKRRDDLAAQLIT
ncbi:MAG: sugar ABC transporter ATP-binding protein [marine bacterium B5-7]|nr:MAG: sugar ABC transporter ATP-binding protein [marine bacterium B5-7]